jgi:CRISPR-associated protein Cmr6
VTIFVGNIAFAATEQDLRDLFRAHGTVLSIAMPVDRDTGRRRGFAFVTLSSEEEESEAIRSLDGYLLFGRAIRVNQDKNDRNSSAQARPQLIRRRQASGQEPGMHNSEKCRFGSEDVPMEYRAQFKERCQRHFVSKQPKGVTEWLDSQIYVREWNTASSPDHPYNKDDWQQEISSSSGNDEAIQAKCTHLLHEARINWRLISNSGVDEGFIRPVIGPGGWPMIPGSSIKGVFKRACATDEDRSRWCGGVLADKQTTPGLLRFHGAWPKNADWGATMLDIAHPQYNWQVGFPNGKDKHNANAVISLFKPTLSIWISSSAGITDAEWGRVRDTLDRALAMGLGGRTAAGYGRTSQLDGDPLFECLLEGQGSPAKRLISPDGLTKLEEFRPTMFRAAIRSMALRLFGGVTDQRTARQAVGALFGSIGQEEGQNLGLLTTAFTDSIVNLGFHRCEGKQQPVFSTTGCLQWRTLPDHKIKVDDKQLQELLAVLHGLTMALGGFGRGWRRPDHRIFLPSYYQQRNRDGYPVQKPIIGCHWEWRNAESLHHFVVVKSRDDLIKLLDKSRDLAIQWLLARGFSLGEPAPWREVIHPERMMIWTRNAEKISDAKAIHWFHKPQDGERSMDPRDVRKSDIAGRMNLVGCIWNRMLPIEFDEQKLVTAKSRQDASAPPRVNPMARPPQALARPGAATQRPPGRALEEPARTSESSSTQAEVWMNHSPGPFLETLVLFAKACDSGEFIKAMQQHEDDDDKSFKQLVWQSAGSAPPH